MYILLHVCLYHLHVDLHVYMVLVNKLIVDHIITLHALFDHIMTLHALFPDDARRIISITRPNSAHDTCLW